MQKVLIVTGTCGVGKSTICWKWANKSQGAYIGCDSLRWWIRNKELRHSDHYQENFIAHHSAILANGYLGLELNVAIDNVWTPYGLSLLECNLNSNIELKVVYLICEMNINIYRDSLRSPKDRMGPRVSELHAELQSYSWPDYVIKIDSTNLSVDDTFDKICSLFSQ